MADAEPRRRRDRAARRPGGSRDAGPGGADADAGHRGQASAWRRDDAGGWQATLAALSIDIRGVPTTKAKACELLRAAILPLAKSYADVSIDVTISASGGDGVARSELDLTVLESLRQLGVEDVELHEGGRSDAPAS